MTQFLNKWIGGLLLILFFSACATSKKVNYKNPKSVTLAFYKALANYDYERAKKLGTAETIKVLSLLQNLHDALPLEEKEAAQKDNTTKLKLLKKATCVIKGEETGEVAECQVCCDEEKAFSTDPLHLKKQDGKWLVHMTKESLQ